MNFSEALDAMKEGKNIKRKNFNFHIQINKSTNGLACYDNTGILGGYRLDVDDLLAEDWEVVEDIPEVQEKIQSRFWTCPKCDIDNRIGCSDTLLHCGNCGQKVKLVRKEDQSDVLAKYKEWLQERIITKKERLDHYVQEKEYVFAGTTANYLETFDLCFDKLEEFEKEVKQ